jgi:hypothetical protein
MSTTTADAKAIGHFEPRLASLRSFAIAVQRQPEESDRPCSPSLSDEGALRRGAGLRPPCCTMDRYAGGLAHHRT